MRVKGLRGAWGGINGGDPSARGGWGVGRLCSPREPALARRGQQPYFLEGWGKDGEVKALIGAAAAPCLWGFFLATMMA